MHCYRHNGQHAVAVCRNCGKAVCRHRSEDTGQGIACCSAYAEEVQENYQLKNRLKQSLGIGSTVPIPASAFMYSFFGLIFLAAGLFLSYSRPGVAYLTLAMSAVFFAMAAVSYKRFRDTGLNARSV